MDATVHSAFSPPRDRLCADRAFAGDHPYQACRIASRVHQGAASEVRIQADIRGVAEQEAEGRLNDPDLPDLIPRKEFSQL